MMHCTIWSEGVREIVSAEDADVKFIVSDHPVTIYNYAVPPDSRACAYPNDPTIALKASQTIFPLNRDFCLILTNLEYARDPSTNPLEKRTFARNYRSSMVRTDAFIRKRKLSSQEVTQINHVLKARACRCIAAGRREWLYPEETVPNSWEKLRTILLPPDSELWHFGGEMYVKYDSGHVHYQDEFGRSEEERAFLKKDLPAKPPRPGEPCRCGSGLTFKACCQSKPVALRRTWSERSIRERNLMLQNAIVNVLGLETQVDWTRVRRDLTDEQIREVYHLYEGLWPLETDLLKLLPKPDGTARAVYTGSIHPETITEFALGAPLYFGEVIVQDPFLHAGTVNKEFSPVENPRAYRQEFLKSVVFFLTIMPLVDRRLVNLIPDPCSFDPHLRIQMMRMAEARAAGMNIDLDDDPRIRHLMEQDFRRGLLSLPRDVLASQFLRASPELDKTTLEETLRYAEHLKENDPLAVLQEDSLAGGDEGGQFNMMKLAPNFEMTMYLAQATGASIITDSAFRWAELNRAIRRREDNPNAVLAALARSIGASEFAFLQNVEDIPAVALDKRFSSYPVLIEQVFKYLSSLGVRGQKPNFEAHLRARFVDVHTEAQAAIEKAGIRSEKGRISCLFPAEGIQDNTVNRLLLMSSSEKHLSSAPMAFFIERSTTTQRGQANA